MIRRGVSWKWAVAGVLVLGACSGDDTADDGGDESAPTTTSATETTAADTTVPDTTVPDTTTIPPETVPPVTLAPLSIGDPVAPEQPVCGQLDIATSTVRAVECEVSHNVELAAAIEVPDFSASADAPDPRVVVACQAPAEALVGGPVIQEGLFIIPVDSEPVDASVSEFVDCWVASPVRQALTGSLTEIPPDEALTELVSVFDIEVGACYVTASDDLSLFTLVRPAECDEPGAEMLTGIVPDDADEYPGSATIEERGRTACIRLFDANEFGTDFFFLVPSEIGWLLGHREYVCSNYVADVSTPRADVDTGEA